MDPYNSSAVNLLLDIIKSSIFQLLGGGGGGGSIKFYYFYNFKTLAKNIT
jgi:hypothetical protein